MDNFISLSYISWFLCCSLHIFSQHYSVLHILRTETSRGHMPQVSWKRNPFALPPTMFSLLSCHGCSILPLPYHRMEDLFTFRSLPGNLNCNLTTSVSLCRMLQMKVLNPMRKIWVFTPAFWGFFLGSIGEEVRITVSMNGLMTNIRAVYKFWYLKNNIYAADGY